MEYNSGRERLIIPEYGRNVQKMVQFAIEEEDRTKRNDLANAIIKVMGQLNPQLRDYSDFTHKLWDHLHIIADFKLDVDSPYEKPDESILENKPDPVPYPSGKMQFRHYGRNIESFIAKAMKMEDGSERQAFTESIANMMKRAYLLYNRDSVTDEVILEHLKELSGGMLSVVEGTQLEDTQKILKAANAGNKSNNSGNKKKNKKKRKKY